MKFTTGQKWALVALICAIVGLIWSTIMYIEVCNNHAEFKARVGALDISNP
jgi:hypothetical protein